MVRRPAPRPLLAAAVVLLLASPQSARAEEGRAAQCVASADRGQVLRDEGKLLESRSEFSACGAESCPAIVRRECVQWLADVDAGMPTVIVSVKRAGVASGDLVGATLTIDGVPRPDAATGRAVALNPGEHLFRATHPDFEATEQRVVTREREKGRLVSLSLASRAGEASRAPVRGPTPLTWTLAGVSVLGFGGFGWFWNQTMTQVGDLRATCAPYCAADAIDDVRPSVLAAQISLGVGVAAAVAAIVTAVLPRTPPASSAASLSSARKLPLPR